MELIISFIGNEVFLILSLLGIMVYAMSKWVLGFKVEKGKYKNFLSVGMACVLSPIIYVIVIVGYISWVSYYPTETFSRGMWISEPEERYLMSEYIIESDMLIGKTPGEVSQILGTDFTRYNDFEMSYYIGFVPGMFRIDPDVLVIRFANGVVAEVRQHQT